MSQPTIARIETGQVDPRVGTLTALLEACGVGLVPTDAGPSPDRPDLGDRSPDERLAWGLAARAEAAAPARPTPFDPTTALRLLADHEVASVVVGDLAALLAGRPAVPERLDVRCRWDDENRRRLAGVLRILSATPADAGGLVLWDGDRLADQTEWLLDTPTGPLRIDGDTASAAFDRLLRDSARVELAGILVPLIG